MNDKKICFITCINDDRQYKECLLYINNLNIPEGYEIDTISVKEAQSMAQGYNGAMQNTDAKYKVYLHQDTFIINKNFIYDVLRTFNSDKNIGMIGVVGAKTIPTNGIWWEPNYKYGQVYESHTGNMELLAFNEVKDSYEEVKAIDGLIMITQYEIPWREDIFDGWHFYDISQSVEFSLKGYKVVIPKQNETWCMHDCGLVKNTMDNMYINKFLNEYSKKIFPLVSILIPTYNRPKYFELALESVLNQTYKNIEIIIGDDSINNETEKLVNKNYLNKYNNIKYYHNVKNLGQFDNDLKLYDMANGEFINYLMDDDLFEKTKIQKMMDYFVNDINEDISLVTSHRAIIDGDGNIGNIFGNTDDIFKKDTIIGGIGFGNFILKTNFNCIGEPTTALFRKNKLNEPFGVYNTRRYGCNVDQASWFNLLSNGKAVFINEVLSYFRMHQGQQQNNIKIKVNGFTDYIYSLLTCKKKGFLLNSTDYQKAIYNCFNLCEIYIIKPLKDKNMEIQEYKNFNKCYNKLKDEKEKIKELKIHCKELEQKSNDKIKNELRIRLKNCFLCEEVDKIFKKYYFDDENNIFIQNGYSDFKYADGSENYIIDVYRKEKKIGPYPVNFIKYIKDWGSEYHLTYERTNILDSIKQLFDSNCDVLELGAGMGAITPWLAENFKSVDCIEGSCVRASALKERTKNYTNVNVFVDDISKADFPKNKYGLITLIGVLEYIPFYSSEKISPKEVIVKFLKKVNNYLKKDGLLVIAIENKLGAKYFSGCTEDHNGKLFSGIMGYPEKSPITFSRYEMEQILIKSGVENNQFYHLLPDYKLPKVIVREDNDSQKLNIGSMTRGFFRDYSGKRQYLMMDSLLLKSFNDANLFFHFSNSFLIACSKENSKNLKTDYLIRKYWNNMGTNPVFHHTIDFIKSNSGIDIKRNPIYFGEKKFENDNYKFNINNEKMVNGESIISCVYMCILKNDNYKSLINIIKKIEKQLLKKFFKNKKDSYGYNYVDGKAIDYCYNNLIKQKDEYVFIDRKWSCKYDITDDYVIYRNLRGIYLELRPFINEKNFFEFTIKIMKSMFPKYNIDRFSYNAKSEELFINFVYNNSFRG